MRVLHLSGGNLYGGVESMLLTMARQRKLCPEMEPEFGVCFEGRLSRELEDAGVAVHRLGGVRVSRPWTVRQARQNLRQLLTGSHFDVVVCHMPWALAIFGNVARRANSALVFWVHDIPAGRHWVERWARRTRPDLAICNSRYTASHLYKLYPSAVRQEVIYCPLQLPAETGSSTVARAEARRELGIRDQETLIVQVSRMERWKGHLLHLEALNELRDVQGWTCWIVGGPQRPKERAYFDLLKTRAGELGLASRVFFAGYRSDVAKILAAADIFCQPNIGAEPLGMAFLEALSLGVPVVTTAIGGATEIVDASCGLLVEPGNAPAVAAGLQRLISSAELRRRLGMAGPERARRIADPKSRLNQLSSALKDLAEPAAEPIQAGARPQLPSTGISGA
jgi:glycosyltransferase involved in cell wall biosynthesis